MEEATNSNGPCSTCTSCETPREETKGRTTLDPSPPKSYKLTSSPGLGRYLIAARALKAGEIIFKEKPLTSGPNALSENVCFACNLVFSKPFLCRECKCPVCNKNCQMSADHQRDCVLLRKIKHPVDGDDKVRPSLLILPLRCLLLRLEQPEKWQLFTSLESHVEPRRGTQIWKIIEKKVAPYLKLADLSCRHTRQSVGTIYTRTNFVTLKYVTDGWGTDSNGFHLVVTAFKDKTELVCREFRCAQKDFCISTDLLCDGVNHCGDNSDETTTSLCADQDFGKILGLNVPVFGAVVSSVGVVLIALTAGIVVCCCRKRAVQRRNPVTSGQGNVSANGRMEDKPPVYPIVSGPMGAEFSAVDGPMPTHHMATGYMTLPLKSLNSGNLDPPVVGWGQMDRNSSIIHSTALYSDMALLAIRWCLAK